MNVFTAYLDTMFEPYPQTPRLLEARAELQTMMEDAYADLVAQGVSETDALGRVIGDFGNLGELAGVLGISAEIGTGVGAPDAGGAATGPEAGRPPAPYPPVTMGEAQGFAEVQRRTQWRLAAAVAVFTVSPILLIVLTVAADAGAVALTAEVAAGIGIVTVLVLVAIGILMVVGIARVFAPFERLQLGRFTADPAVSSWADELSRRHDRRRFTGLGVAIVIWVLAPVPLILQATLGAESFDYELRVALCVALILVLAAVGLLIVIPAAWARSVADALHRGWRPADG